MVSRSKGVVSRGFNFGKLCFKICKLILVDGAGEQLLSLGVQEGQVEVVDRDGNAKLIVDAQRFGDVKDVDRLVLPDDDRFGFVNSVRWQHVGADLGDLDRGCREKMHRQQRGADKDGNDNQDRQQVRAAFGLGEGRIGHRVMVAECQR